MLHQNTYILLVILHIVRTLQALSQIINVRDAKEFEIALDDMNYDEESENEMIQPADLEDLLKPLAEDEGRYKPLHSHVRYYNERNAEVAKRFSNVFSRLQPHAKEIFGIERNEEPFVAGFKEELDEYFSRAATKAGAGAKSIGINPASSDRNEKSMQNLEKIHSDTNNTTNITDQSANVVRMKRQDTEDRYGTVSDEKMDFFQILRNRTISETEYLAETQAATRYDDEYDQESASIANDTDRVSTTETRRSTFADEESYDYSKFKMEYEQQIEDNVKRGKALNYTEKEEDAPRKALKRIMDLKRPRNCTKEELSQIGVRAMECLIYDYQRAKDVAAVKKILLRTWIVLRVWLLIYVCLAIPCWCQRGWCCWCFRCKFCFPRKRILFSKQYCAINPPGTYVKDLKKQEDVIKYEATEHERDAYETFEAAIKHI
ncbi:uncharacterized protein LOC109852613 [Pseudomyrmex gracilis]|uniref:uncharacterized protein LOC109852613 n=1 Tax=Pseudomyrmex gracilis TaxID=219809 RepID=UPI0009959F15|nr:uncharacterized protein LOC109852613 [Pseudomyrmex gracilis]